jgi:electron transfer flavoprotein beta subunit
MKAKKKPLETLTLGELHDDTAPQLNAITWTPPTKRAKGLRVNSVDALISALKDKGLVA